MDETFLLRRAVLSERERATETPRGIGNTSPCCAAIGRGRSHLQVRLMVGSATRHAALDHSFIGKERGFPVSSLWVQQAAPT
jgi:hypothetical protein